MTDRRARVIASSFNGIDFVEVAANQTDLRVHFLNGVKPQGLLTISITGGERVPTVAVFSNLVWTQDGGHLVLNLSVAAPGDFSRYTLTITSSRSDSRLDPYFSSAVFSFKANCPSDLDCRPAPVICPAPVSNPPPIDYLAKDFLSFRQALLDFSALRYPEWQERSEADFGVMFLEALCSLADDLSYTQDRIAAEAALETATQRRSVVRHARLVDYWPRPSAAATVLLQFNVKKDITIEHGTVVTARGPDGTVIPFETGPGLAQRDQPPAPVRRDWNAGIPPYYFEDSQQCLRAGSTQMYILGTGYQFQPNQLLLLETQPPSSADAPVRQIVRLLDSKELCDPLEDPERYSSAQVPVLACPVAPKLGVGVTQLIWGEDDAILVNRDLNHTILAGNLVPATQGLKQPVETFTIPSKSSQPSAGALAVVRTGPNDTPHDPSLEYLYTLHTAPLAWLHAEDPTQPPELVLKSKDAAGQVVTWTYLRWLLDAQPLATAFTVDAARYSLMPGGIGAAPRYEYDGDAGDTLRFGDSTFGIIPDGSLKFEVTYRVGGGAAGNVAADTITSLPSPMPNVNSVTNPQPATGGADAEPLDNVRRLAPQAFRAVQQRAVLAADYQAAAETLPWVLRAGCVFRWTGSWLTVFTTPEPKDNEQISLDQRQALIELLNRYRMVGHESYVPDPRYLSLDLLVEVCAMPTAFQADVEQSLLAALGTSPAGFFHHSNFTFGQPLQLSALEAAIQAVNGVAGVTCVRYRIRGKTAGFMPMQDAVTVGVNEIIRCDNDPSLPEHGSLSVLIQGGR